MKSKLFLLLCSMFLTFGMQKTNAESYILAFDANGGTNVTSGNFAHPYIPCGVDESGICWVQVTVGAPYFYGMENERPFRRGYKFLGWYDAPKGGEQVYDSTGMCINGKYWRNKTWVWHDNVVLYAHWQKIN
jgi:hypothetical protein